MLILVLNMINIAYKVYANKVGSKMIEMPKQLSIHIICCSLLLRRHC